MLLTKEVEIGLCGTNVKWFEDKGYIIPREKDNYGRLSVPKGTKIKVKVEDLPSGSHVFIDIKCDCCNKIIKNKNWKEYLRYTRDNQYYCRECATELFAREKTLETILKNSKSFEQWCIENNHQDILDRWDYELNGCKPNEICFSTMKRYYFKCPMNIHESELKNIVNIQVEEKEQ